MPSFGAQTVGGMQLSFTEIRKPLGEEDLEEKLRILFCIHYSKCLSTSEWKSWVVVRSESEVQGRGHAWRYNVRLPTLDELTQGVRVSTEEL